MFIRALIALLLFTTADIAALAEPPTVSRETTLFLEPLDDEGYVDYVAALNRFAKDGKPLPKEDNAFTAILKHINTSRWSPELRQALADEFQHESDTDTPHDRFDIATAISQYTDTRDQFKAAYERITNSPWTAIELPDVSDFLKTLEAPLNDIAQAIHADPRI